MKLRGAGKRKEDRGIPALSPPGHGALRARHFGGLRFLEPPPAYRPREIHRLVSLFVLAGRCDDRLGDVPFHSLKRLDFADKLAEFFCRCYCRYTTPR
jgi:hypothetical protein